MAKVTIRKIMSLASSAALVFAMAVAIFAPIKASAAVDPYSHVFVVHGYGSCQDVSTNTFGPIAEQYYSGTPMDHLHGISYYGCDTKGESIQGAGPQNSPDCVSTDAAVQAKCPAFLRSPDNDFLNTDLRRFSYELAWYIYNNYGAKPVALVGHSMGGLIITHALQQIAAKNPAYPPALSVQTVVTFSSPLAGAGNGTYNGKTDLQLRQYAVSGPDSIIPAIQKAGAPQVYAGKYTLWALEGSSAGCDIVPATSSLALRGATHTVDYTTPCYAHTDYLWDSFKPADATGKISGKPFTNGYHSLDFMHYVISYQEKLYNK